MTESTIYVGTKPPAAYMQAVMNVFWDGGEEATLKARGRAILQAVDASQMLKRIVPEVEIDGVEIGTEELENDDGSKSRVSSIEISLSK